MQQHGLSEVLYDIEHAIVALLDRWTVKIQALPLPARPIASLQRMGSLSHAESPKARFRPTSQRRLMACKEGRLHR